MKNIPKYSPITSTSQLKANICSKTSRGSKKSLTRKTGGFKIKKKIHPNRIKGTKKETKRIKASSVIFLPVSLSKIWRSMI